MPKSHTIKLNIKNDTTSPMLYHSNWFDSGRVANNFEFPKIIKKGENHTVVCYERDWALSGCSGYAQYTINGNIVTIAFSNPSAGSNKVGAGIADNGKTIWEKISSHDYQDFQVDMKVGTMPMIVHCKCSGGDTNDAKVVFHMPFSLRQDTNFAAPLCTANQAYPPSANKAYPPSNNQAYPPQSNQAYPPPANQAYPPPANQAYRPPANQAYPPQANQAAHPPPPEYTASPEYPFK